jgi:ADP-heptose:LPS heptosyltransferase
LSLHDFLEDCRWTLLWLLDTPWRRRVAAHDRSVLVLRPDALGDFVLWLGAGRALAAHYRGLGFRVVLLANAAWADLARAAAGFDEVVPLEHARFVDDLRYRRDVMRGIRAARFDTVVNPVYSRDLAWSESLVATSGARERIGQAGDLANIAGWHRALADRHYTRLVPNAGEAHEARRAAHFNRALGAPAGAAGASLPRVAGVELPREFFVLAPGAGKSMRRWPAARFGALAQKIGAATGWTGVVCGAASERPLFEAVRRHAPGVALLDLTGSTSLPQLCGVLAQSRLVVGNESGIVHLAAALRVPSVCVLGGGHFGRFMPYEARVPGAADPGAVYSKMECFNCNWRCRYALSAQGVTPCVDRVDVEAVWRAAQQRISGA